MNRVHILTPSTVPGDAISNDVFGMRRWFRRQGFRVRVYAGTCDDELRHLVRPLRAYRRYAQVTEDILIYHHSVGWRAGWAAYRDSRNRKIIKYHNVTRPVFFEPYNSNYVRTCLRGEQQTRWLAQSNAELFLSDSDFNGQDLSAAGASAEACHTVPPFHHIGRLMALAVDEALATELRGRENWLFVGRVSPNKGQLHLIRALGYYHHYLRRRAHLLLVGGIDSGLNVYNQQLNEEIRRQCLQGWVHFRGKVNDCQLKTYYAHASAFVCASEHEGFCVPLAEAMYYGVPVVAYGGSAVGGTLGDAGLVWETPSPLLFAESVHALVSQPDIRTAVVRSQRRRYWTQFSTRAIARRLGRAVTGVIHSRESAAKPW